jgi:hypothetical protein
MPAAPSAAKRLKKLAAEIPDDAAIRAILQSIEHPLIGRQATGWTDHVIVLIGASVVEKALEVAIVARLRPLTQDERERIFNYDHRGPLSDLSSRIKMAYALDAFGPKTRDDLAHLIHRIGRQQTCYTLAINICTPRRRLA